MCVYSSLPLEGDLGLLLDSKTLGRKLVQQDEKKYCRNPEKAWLIMAGAGQAFSEPLWT